MVKMIKGLLIVILFFTCALAVAKSPDPCAKGGELRKGKMEFDVAERRKRAALNEEIGKVMLQGAGLDRQMADLKEKMMTTPHADQEKLWDRYDEMGALRDRLMNETVKDLRLRSSKISQQKFMRLNDYNIEELDLRYKCAQNEALGERLLMVATSSDPTLSQLALERIKLSDELAAYYTKIKAEIDKMSIEEKKLEYESEATELRAYQINDEANRKTDAFYSLIDQLNSEIARFNEKMSSASKELLEALGK